MVVTIVGTGLIGGSIAIALREQGLASRIIGVEASEAHRARALERKLVDEMMNWEEALAVSDLVVLSIPVNDTLELLPRMMDQVKNQVVIDVGSTKDPVCRSLKDHPKRGRFVATHPMWGTEYSGPDAAVKGAFKIRPW